ncbi:unnamed protein product (macronuclear) [Paramecium tetraurelia]|uniref:CTD-like phosphatase, putative n=1 Tax=Paramecium tetraurelia TaxID=5888 RepID=Q6BGI1_PARTE|nr:CTD-like phosphatase [Paramecium tetraurelia strain d4-2]XP_001423476.1 uncharacterized protein GSPATT00000514001 [Paramecium tetraurelia]CAH03239.1 CTD-like phosphatase, putative [Paramecium tetraurelia]CAK56078.1 unnamed protein product [Paramecium tetraurelia]|eukprot:XP_001423476.1 hypothetical protein (macronuclear) [Paramecium tetraurelia strain d4-2]
MNCLQYIKRCFKNFRQKLDGQDSSYQLSTQNSQVRRKKTLVLDLDETLVHCEFKENPNFHYETILDVWHRGVLYTVYLCKRPYLREFLQQLSAYYEIIVFTAGYESYCDKVLQHIDIDRHISDYFARSNCRFVNGICLKDLSILDRPLDQLIFIDNNANAFEMQPENGLLIPSFLDSDEDECLLRLIPFLKQMAHKPKVIPVSSFLSDYESIHGALFNDMQVTLQGQAEGEEGSLSEESVVVLEYVPKHRKTQTTQQQQKQFIKTLEQRSQTLFSG